MAKIVNISFKLGKVPDLLKTAKVCPIFKDGCKKSFENYRPISILPSFSKIFERLVYNRLYKYIDKHCILSPKQYGFRAGHSTNMALLDFYDRVSSSIEDKLFTIGVFIDLKKAFDTIDHQILLKKLYHYGIRGVAYDWFESYLAGRQQYVTINNITSSLRPVVCGVPQGSILGPLLFILYINDIVNCSKTLFFTLFADDTNLLFSGKDLRVLFQNLNIELEKLSCWFRANKLSLNVKKSNFIIFGRKKLSVAVCNLDLVLDGSKLEQVTSTKFLGVYIDDKLNWNLQVSKLSKKISKSLGIIRKVSHRLTSETLGMLYNSMILPHLSYCLMVWGGTSKKNIETLLKLQKRAVRIISKSRYRDHSDPLFYNLKFLKLFDLYKQQIVVFVYKQKYSTFTGETKGVYPTFVFPDVDQTHSTRNTMRRIVIPGCKTEIRKKGIACSGPRIWNSIPVDIRNSVYLSEFKRLTKSYLLQQYLE
jgi:Reverse transcriptase (RNA-dependent DNA polymerase)